MIVVDASIAAKWILPETDSDLALALLTDHSVRGERVVGPALLPFELSNACWQRMRRGAITPEEADVALEQFLALPIVLRPVSNSARRRLHARAFAVAGRYGLPATYDAHYLALAEHLRCELWTADARLLSRLEPRPTYVRALDEYVPEPPSPF